MHRGSCRGCGKPLKDQPAALTMDDAGYRYHFACWSQVADTRIQANRQAAKRRKKIKKARGKSARARGRTSRDTRPKRR